MLDKHLATWLFFLTANILCITISQNVNLSYSGDFLYLGYILVGLHGFFLYLCTKSLINHSHKDFKKEYVTIAVYWGVAITGFFFYNSYPQTTAVITRIFAFCFNAFFIILAVRLFHRYKAFLETNFSNIDKLSFNWMRFLAFGLILILSGALILVILHEFSSFQFSLYSLFAIIVLLFVNILGFRGIKHSTIFNQVVIPYNQPQTEEPTSISKDKSYENYGLKQEDAISLSEQLKNYMETEKPYTNIDLNLKDLAAALETYPHYITQVLNTVFNQNFYDFINTYRTEEAQRRLIDPQFKKLTVLAIAYDCGFNSKSTFNRIFKQKTGLTPSEYRSQ
ncbi:helix-turn-helix domain-containing protein [Proteiniphilum sp. UBA5384]|uniref:helix-turn-helix domain-containing protein n=1 Tax=Proteiniphilum sp. UBA5384 TaxID=1947279 RepID=UPI0025F22C5C|nr:helix-turn-helix domain-containing protein [Proteiniphilum sp. UBA5384]